MSERPIAITIPDASSRRRPNSLLSELGDSGCYQLLMVLDEDVTLRIGALGKLNFKKDHYLYTGRAKRGLKSRIRRHISMKKKKRWHIDYLLTRVRITKIFYYHGRLDECIINNEVLKRVKGQVVKNFGSSDCRCEGHLIRVDEEPNL